MATKAVSRLFICKSCRNRISKFQSYTRAFTTSQSHSKVIPSFDPTSSPELDDILLSYRTKVFTPAALQQHHRDLMYRPTRHAVLLNDPGITVTLSNDEEIKLMPMDPHDRPNKHKTLNRFVELLAQSPESSRWNNLPAFLVGMSMAKENLPEGWLEKVVRKANEQDRAGVIIRCMEMSKKTRMTLADAALTRELMIGFHSRVVGAKFERETLERVMRQAEYVVLMMDKTEHCSGKLADAQRDMRRDLTVLGVLLELAAAHAVRFKGAVDTDGKVARYAEKTLTVCKDDAFDVSEETLVMERQLLNWLPLWNGMRLAMEVEAVAQSSTGQRMHMALGKLESSVFRTKDTIQEKVQMVQGKQRRCLAMYHELQEV